MEVKELLRKPVLKGSKVVKRLKMKLLRHRVDLCEGHFAWRVADGGTNGGRCSHGWPGVGEEESLRKALSLDASRPGSSCRINIEESVVSLT